jgi:ABC-2 type transport system permease protein
MFRFLVAEILKLRRSLAVLLCLAAPAMVAALTVLVALNARRPMPWNVYASTGALFWAFAMLPLAATALAVLLAQVEHGPRMWNHLLALPRARPALFVAKAVMMIALVALMSAALFLMLQSGGWLLEAASPGKLAGPRDMLASLVQIAEITGAGLLLTLLQLWAALRFRNFVPPLAIGIGGTFVAVTATNSYWGRYFPWLLPMNAGLPDAERAQVALSLGLGGGLIVLVAMVAHLSLREA